MISTILKTISIITCFGSTAFCQTDSAESDLRRPRTWALSAEVGMNSLSSLIGPVATWYAKPRLAVDFGIGLSSVGLRPGIRARYLFSLDKVAYYAGAGLKYGLGSGGQDVKIQDPDTKKDIMVQIKGSGFGDLMLGVEYLANNGFLVIANAGYSVLMGGKNYTFANGTVVSDKTDKAFQTVFGSGVLLSVSLGKAF